MTITRTLFKYNIVKSFDRPFHCKPHFEKSDALRAVSDCGTPIYPCKRQHGDAGRSRQSHLCKGTIMYRSAFVNHLEKHVLQVKPEEGNSKPSKGC